ncbi:MAG: pitrilysin family protein [Bdellovibrionota bacterium]
MKAQKFYTIELPNGITLLGEEMEGVQSAALAVLVPTGAAKDPAGLEGVNSVMTEMFQKGAGPWGSRELSEQFEELGIHKHHSSGIEVSVFSASMIADQLPRAIELLSTLLLQPHLPAEELESVRELALQDIESLEDEPASKVMTVLAEQFYPFPFGRSQLGTAAGVSALTIENVKQFYDSVFRAERLVIAVAGKFNWNDIRRTVEKSFGEWRGKSEPLAIPPLGKSVRNHHVQQDTNQVQIALAYPSVSFGHPEYYTARVATNVLSGGMAGRLFIEVREKLGLVYRVGASHSAARGRGAIFAYAGTTPENAEKCLSVMLKELRGLGNGVSAEELARAKVDLKAAVIMQSELSSVRVSALVNDWWNLGRLRTLKEIRDAIENVTNEDIVQHLAHFPVSPVTLVTLGPKGLPQALEGAA